MNGRTKLILLFCCFLFLSHIVIAQSGWRMIAPYPPRQIDPYSCVTVQGKAYFWCSKDVVYSTNDGGKSFYVYPPYASVEDVALGCCSNQGIAFADSLIGYVADVAHGEFRTTDGGFTWTKVASVGSNTMIILFGNSYIGWKFGGIIGRTTDAGNTWNSVYPTFGYEGSISKAFALDGNWIWVAKSSYYMDQPRLGSIWRSVNGGIDYIKVISAPSSDSTKQVSYSDLRFNLSGLGVAIGRIRRDDGMITSFASRTTNFGTSWITTEFPAQTTYIEIPAYDPKTILSISDSIWLIFGQGSTPYMRRSVDYGKTWQFYGNMFAYQSNNRYGTAIYIPEYNSVVVSTFAGLYRSSDYGETFLRIADSMDLILTGVSADVQPIDKDKQLIVAKSGGQTFLWSENGGTKWNIGSFGSQNISSSMQVRIAAGTIYSMPNQTSLYKSTDKGNSWQQLYLPVSSGIRALGAFDNDNVALQAGEKILYSSDGGSSWKQTPFPGNYWLNESSIPMPGMVVGGGGFYDSTTKGIIYRTTDAGYNWQIIDFPREINHLKMVTPTTGFAISRYEVYKTTNGGKTWMKIMSSSDYYTHYDGFFFDDSLRGLMRVSFDCLETTNGGISWQKRELGEPFYSIAEMVHTKSGDLLVVGAGILWGLSSYAIPFKSETDNDTLTNLTFPGTLTNYPNPFNPTTQITYSVPKATDVTIKIYDVLGREIALLVNERKQAGEYTVGWNAAGVPSGVYFYRIVAGEFVETKKMLVIK